MLWVHDGSRHNASRTTLSRSTQLRNRTRLLASIKHVGFIPMLIRLASRSFNSEELVRARQLKHGVKNRTTLRTQLPMGAEAVLARAEEPNLKRMLPSHPAVASMDPPRL